MAGQYVSSLAGLWAKGGEPGEWRETAEGRANRALQGSMFQQQLDFYNKMLGLQREQTGGLSSLINSYNQQFAEAKAANEAKYKEALGLVDQTSGQQAADIRSDYAKQRSSALQNLARSGMSNTTVGSTLSQGLQREESASLNRLADALLEQKTDIMQGFEYKYPEAGITQAAIAALAPSYNFPSF